MRTLYIIRHAKSSWTYKHLDDYDRPLGVRGRNDVLRMAKFLSKEISAPEKIVSSPASRAFYTALFLADAWGVQEELVELEAGLYHADEEEIIDIIMGQSAEILAITGHNPGFTDIVNELTNTSLSNLPTCGIFGISFDIDDWTELEIGKGKQLFYYTPKSI